MARLRIIILAAFVLISDEGYTQTRNHLLRGTSKFELVFEDLGTHAKECGLTEEAVRAAVMYPLSSAKIQVVSDSNGWLYVSVQTLYLAALHSCVSSVQVKAVSYQKVVLEFSDNVKSASVELWDKGLLATTDKSRHLRNVSESIEEKLKQFITDWNLDNRPGE